MSKPPYARFETSGSTMDENEGDSICNGQNPRIKALATNIGLLLLALAFVPWLLSPSKHGLETIRFPSHTSFTVYNLVDTYPDRENRNPGERDGEKEAEEVQEQEEQEQEQEHEHEHEQEEKDDNDDDDIDVDEEEVGDPTSSAGESTDPGTERTENGEEEKALKVIQAVVTSSSTENELRPDSGQVVERLPNTSYCNCVRRSSLVLKACNNSAARFGKVFQILITGVGRSGTDFIHAELWRLGIRMSHDNHRLSEMVGSVAWPEAFNELSFRTQGSHYKRCAHPGWNFHRRNYGYKHVFHLVRDPLHTIRSRYNLGNIAAFKSVTKCNMEDWHGSALCTTLQHWTLWNSFVEQTAAFRFRLEDIDTPAKHSILTKIAELGKLEETPHFDKALFERMIDNVTVSAQRNSGHTRKGKRRLTWDKLAKVCTSRHTAMAQIQAIRYGYIVAEENLVPDVWDECDPLRKTLKVQRCFFREKTMKWTCRLFSDKCQAS